MSAPGSHGVFVTFEGVEGSGKSTQLARLAGRLRDVGTDVVITREPGGTEIGRRLRAILLEPSEDPVTPFVELLLYTADRAQHVETVIRPALDRGAVVLCDRYLDATLAYQGHGRGLGTRIVLDLHSRAPLDLRPARTILLDVEPEHALERARRRNEDRGLTGTEGRFEDENLTFHRRVRDGYLTLARSEPGRYRVVSGDGNPDEVECRVLEALSDILTAPRAENES